MERSNCGELLSVFTCVRDTRLFKRVARFCSRGFLRTLESGLVVAICISTQNPNSKDTIVVARTPLPKDKRRVADLLDICKRCTQTISERKQSRLAQQQVLYQKPRTGDEEAERERVLAELRERELKARTRFPIDVLLPYFGDQRLLDLLIIPNVKIRNSLGSAAATKSR